MPSNRTHKARGSAAERELVHLLWERGWAAFRSPASGSMPYELPDVIAGCGSRKVAIECKITVSDSKYLTHKEVGDLVAFAQRFGSEAWIGVKFLRRGWRFINPEDARKTPASWVVTWQDAERKGLTFEEFVG